MMESYTVMSIVCPGCGADLDPTADICEACGARTTTGQPLVAPPKPLMDRPWLLVVVLLHVGVLGIPLYWKANYPAHVRLGVIAASIVYTIFALVVILWGGKFIIDQIRLLA